MAWPVVLLLLVLGFFLLWKGADWLVGGGAQIARNLGIGPLLIGLTIVAWGTSAPELVVSAGAAYEGRPEMTLGNVLGSNIANIGLVLGACALVLPRILERAMGWREIFWLFASIGGLLVVSLDKVVTRQEGTWLLVAFAVHNLVLLVAARADPGQVETAEEGHYPKPWLWTLWGAFGIALGAKLVVEGAVGAADKLGVDGRVVSLTVVAIGTSLPELAAGLASAFKGKTEISLGNVVGSNVFNTLAVIGIVAVLHPLDPALAETEAIAGALDAAFSGALSKDFPWVFGFSVAVVLLPFLGRRGGRWKAALLLAAYVYYTWQLYVSG